MAVKSKTDLLHDEIDEAERLSRQAAVVARRTIARELPLVMGDAAGKGKKGLASGDVMFGLRILVERVALAMRALTTQAVHLGGEAGKRRSKK